MRSDVNVYGSIPESEKKLNHLLHQVCENDETIFISKEGRKNAVIISEREYNSLLETIYLTSSPKNAERLFESLRQLE
ncbi:MAG: type II toxin-antitoxin system Phd/YefM family antitoxin [Exiguobacterium sp.]|uniref:type II toxin-antitoxin system Phd/YefM family antitoxin n=1 Tax=Exiguobacterium TaxID=33986 RepID=UPI001BE9428B|nr:MULTISPECIES: type II toxin-antitoxin system Phd/YefM family antitoxin [Exiguobacterium]MBQ6458873.1 type II toxin-antitoxin system Phd/YefM family antitoxin [Exiguobacterium sp.]MBR2757561.1 type II toxin-antitoxin system Phd/YefM family antitoxin [Exiguobacterium sp.]MBR3062473.1 type II toxin-antitoxin system Phd/YefM family antitoxin [Exiguobacterium sp.]